MRFIKREDVEKEDQKNLLKFQQNVLLSNKFVNYKENEPHVKFERACQSFRLICKEIQNLLGLEKFHGGYDELLEIIDNEKLNTEEGKLLKEKLNLANNICILEAKKIGLSSPDWFSKCWDQQD